MELAIAIGICVVVLAGAINLAINKKPVRRK